MRGRDSVLIALITTITDPSDARADAYHGRWEEETANDQMKTHLRGPGWVLRSRLPDLAHQEIWAYLIVHHAISALTAKASAAADLDPDREWLLRDAGEADWPGYRALIMAAHAERRLRQLYPYTSHWMLRFSTTTASRSRLTWFASPRPRTRCSRFARTGWGRPSARRPQPRKP